MKSFPSDFNTQKNLASGSQPFILMELKAGTEMASGNALWDSNLKGVWHFNNDYADSKGTNDGTRYGSSQLSTAAKLGSHCLYCDGTNDYVDVGSGTDFNVSSFSISCWIKTPKFSGSGASRSIMGNFTYDVSGLWLEFRDDFTLPLRLFFAGGGIWETFSVSAYSGSYPDDAAWHHVVAVKEGTTLHIYIDSIQRGYAYFEYSSLENTAENMTIGANRGTNKFKGCIDEVLFFNDDLTAAEVAALYNEQKSLYLSDIDMTVNNINYQGKILSRGNLGSQIDADKNSVNVGTFNLSLINNPRIDNLISNEGILDVYWYFGGTAAPQLIFRGVPPKDFQPAYNINKIDLEFVDIGELFEAVVGEPLLLSDYSGADPDDIGKIKPIPIGVVKNSPCLMIDAGAVSTLAADLAVGANQISLTDASRFPSSGTLIIGGEDDIAYTGKSGNNLTGVTGVSYAYYRGAAVMQKKTTIKALASAVPLKTIINARIVPAGKTHKEAVAIPAAYVTYNTNDNGIGSITISNMLAALNLMGVGVRTQPGHDPDFGGSNPSQHLHQPASNTTVSYFCDDATLSLNGGWADNLTFVVNKEFQGVTNIGAYSSFSMTAKKLAAENYSGTVKKIKAKVKAGSSYASGLPLTLKLYINSVLKETVNFNATTTPGVQQTSFYDVSGFAWSDFNSGNTYIVVASNGGAGAEVAWLYEAWFEVEYLPAQPTETLAVNRTIDVALSGNSIADLFGGRLICDIEGIKDDSAGHYTGTANALIEKPDDVFHLLIENFSNGATHADIDLMGSFADVAANLPASYKFGFVITEPVKLSELLPSLAMQCFCRFSWDAGLARLSRIKTASDVSVKSIDAGVDAVLSDNQLQISFQRPLKTALYDIIHIKYNLERTLGGWQDNDAYADDAVSGAGKKSLTIMCFAIGDNDTMANDLASKWYSIYSISKKPMMLTTSIKHLELECGDVVSITCAPFSMTSVKHEVISIDLLTPEPISEKAPRIEFKLLEL